MSNSWGEYFIEKGGLEHLFTILLSGKLYCIFLIKNMLNYRGKIKSVYNNKL